MAFTPDEIAALQNQLAVQAQQDSSWGAPTVANQPPLAPMGPSGVDAFAAKLGAGAGELGDRWGQSARRMADQPAMGLPGQLAGAALGPQPRDPTSFQRSAPEELSPMNAQAPDVQATPTLASRGSYVAGEQPRPAMRGGGAPGGGGASGGLAGARNRWLSQESNLVGNLDTEKDILSGRGDAEISQMEQRARLEQDLARRQERDAQLQAATDEQANAKHAEFMAHNQKLADDLGREKIDPKRLFKEQGAGHQFMFMLGGALGGFLGAANGTGKNEFLAGMERMVDRDIAAQEKTIDNKKAQLSARQSLMGQMVQQHGDRRLAAMQTKNAMYEAAKLHIKAKGDEASSPIMKANADLQVNAIQGKQDELLTGIAQRSYQTLQQQAQAAAAAQAAQERLLYQRAKDLEEMAFKRDELNLKRFEAEGKYGEAAKKQSNDDNAAVGEATKRLADDDVVKNRDLIQRMERRIDPKTGEVTGLSRTDDALSKMGNTKGLNAINPLAHVLNRTTSDETKLSQRDFNQAKLLYQTKVTGSGGSDEQMAKIGEAFEGANSMAEKREAIRMLAAELHRREGLAQASLSDQQKALLQQRLAREGQTDMPSSVVVKK